MESSNSRPLAGEIDHYNNVNLHHSFKSTAYDEINIGDLPYQAEFNPHDQQQQFMTYSDNQMLTDQLPIGGNNYGGVDNVNLLPQSQDESLYFQRRQEIEEEQRVLEMRRQVCLIATNEPNPLKRKRLLSEMQQQQQQSDELRRRQIDQNRPVITVDLQALCMKRVDLYIQCQKNRPKDNNIEYWWKFVSEFFHPQAKKRWCVSLYRKAQQTTQDNPQNIQGAWHCELCNKKPGNGFEASYTILANLFKIKYESGVIEEVLALDDPGGRHCKASGRVTLIYGRAVQQTIYEKLRVVREGRLLVDFTPELKILSLEFCAVRHQEFIPRQLMLTQIKIATDKCIQSQKSADDTELRSSCSEFVSLARSLAKIPEAPTLNEYGFDKRYVITLMINGVLEATGPVMDFSYAIGIEPPIESHAVLDVRQSTASAGQVHDDDYNWAR